MSITRYSGKYEEKLKENKVFPDEENKVIQDEEKEEVEKKENVDFDEEIEKDIAKGDIFNSFMNRMRQKAKQKRRQEIAELYDYARANAVMENKKITEEIKELPNWKAYNKGYGKAYTKLMYAAIPGIAFFIIMSILGYKYNIFIKLPQSLFLLSYLITAFYTGSLLLIPFLIALRIYSFKRFKGSYLLFRRNEIIYHKDIIKDTKGNDKLYKYEEYRIKLINPQYQETLGYFKCRGLVTRVEVINGKEHPLENTTLVNIPKVFKNMEMIHDYAPEPDIKIEKFFVWK